MSDIKYPLAITTHARERWIERIVDSTRYAHLGLCKNKISNCARCSELMYDIRNAVLIAARNIDREIHRRYSYCKENNLYIKDKLFLEAMKKEHGEDMQYMEFLLNGNAVFMTSTKRPNWFENKNPAPVPTLITVLNYGMIEGTVFKRFDGEEIKTAFRTWKFHTKTSGKIKPV